MRKAIVLLAVFAVFSCFAYAADSDNDSVSDEQEAMDGTDPNNAGDNALEIRIEGSQVVGNSLDIYLFHGMLGRIHGVDFSIEYPGARESNNSGSVGTVPFTVKRAGRHVVTVQKGAYSNSAEFFPACVALVPLIGGISWAVDFLALFVSLVVALLAFAGFKKLLAATDADYPLKKYPVVVPAYVGAASFIISVYLYFSLPLLPGLILLFFVLLALIVVLWLFRVTGFLRGVPGKALPTAAKRAVKGLAFPTLLFAALVERFRGKKAEEKSESRGRMREMLVLRRDISESMDRFADAKKRSVAAGGPVRKQEAMNELREEVVSFNQYFKRMLGIKRKPVVLESMPEKSLSELREEKRTKIMVEDLLAQMAKEMNVLELPEGAKPEPKPVSKSRGGSGMLKKLYGVFVGSQKSDLSKSNSEIALFDDYGNALEAGKAEFFIAGK